MRTAIIGVLVFGLAVSAPPAHAQEAAEETAGLDVAEAVVTTGVQDRTPSDTLSSVPADIGRVYLWTRVTGAEGETEVVHVWYHGDEERARVPLRVASPDWRTWSSKQIVPSWTGEWRVEVVGPAGDVLETAAFTVR